jgi:chromosome segregation ATPase
MTRDSEVVVTLAQTQAELEKAAAEIAKLKAELLESRERKAKRLREGKETARRIEKLEARVEKLEAEVEKYQGKASAVEAHATAKARDLVEARAEARRKIDTLQQAIARGEARFAKMKEAAGSRPSTSSGPAPYTEAEIEEFESTFGDLEAKVRILNKESKADAAEIERLSKAVANFGDKHKELFSARAAIERLERKNVILEAENERLRARYWPDAPGAAQGVPLYDIARDRTVHGSSYNEYFGSLIAPAMLDTGASPEQINAIIRKMSPTSTSPPHLPLP